MKDYTKHILNYEKHRNISIILTIFNLLVLFLDLMLTIHSHGILVFPLIIINIGISIFTGKHITLAILAKQLYHRLEFFAENRK